MVIMDYGINAIYHKDNFATQDELNILNSYMNDLPQPEIKSINLISDIKNDVVKETMIKLDERIQEFVEKSYFPSFGYSVKMFGWFRELELIKWSSFAQLPAHIDGDDVKEYPVITIGGLIYLNDEYHGGEIAFPEYEVMIKPQPGDLVLFPCHYLHEVKVIRPLEEGVTRRHTMPVFYTLVIQKND